MYSNSCVVGLEVLQQNPNLANGWGRVSLLSNQASLTKKLEPSWEVLSKILGKKFVSLMGPQHGLESCVQDNMLETDHSVHHVLNIPVYSLYSKTREPTEEMLSNVDTIVIDLQLTGCRVYTFKYTIAACLRVAKKYNKKVVVLDRANPLGGRWVEGNTLEKEMKSFVGEFEIPMRYALTAAEITKFFNQTIEADLEVIPLKNWDHTTWKRSQDRQWIYTSPNIPSLESMYPYCGMVLFEGCSISEGRGTTLPFQLIGSSNINEKAVDKIISTIYQNMDHSSFILRPTCFQPTFNKFQGKVCYGFQIIVIDPDSFPSYKLGLMSLKAFMDEDPNFGWKQPPYEYNYDILPVKLITGKSDIIEALTKKDFCISDSIWSKGIDDYIQQANKVLLYARDLVSIK